MPDLAPYLPPVMSDVVIDLYHGDKVNIDFSSVKSTGIDAVILKATQGVSFADPAFAPRVANARAAGLLVATFAISLLTRLAIPGGSLLALVALDRRLLLYGLALSLLSLRGLLQLVPLLSEVSKYTSVLVPVFAV